MNGSFIAIKHNMVLTSVYKKHWKKWIYEKYQTIIGQLDIKQQITILLLLHSV